MLEHVERCDHFLPQVQVPILPKWLFSKRTEGCHAELFHIEGASSGEHAALLGEQEEEHTVNDHQNILVKLHRPVWLFTDLLQETRGTGQESIGKRFDSFRDITTQIFPNTDTSGE